MDLLAQREDVWAASIDDKPGALGHTLSVLTDAGADLDFVILRRAPEKPGTGVIFVTPLRGDREIQAASLVGFSVTSKLHSVRVEGVNERGIAAKLTRAIGDAGIKVRGMSMAVLSPRFIAHFGVDSADDEKTLIDLLSAM